MQEYIVTLENLCLSVSGPEIEDIMASKHALNVLYWDLKMSVLKGFVGEKENF